MSVTVEELLAMSSEEQAAVCRTLLVEMYGEEEAEDLMADEPDEGPGYDDLPYCECGGRLVPFRPCCQDEPEPVAL